MKAFVGILLLAVPAVLVLSGCMSSLSIPGDCAQFYPELPDNEYCFRKIAELHAFVNDSKNQKKEEWQTSDGKTFVANVITPPYSNEAYLGILLGRGAIGQYRMVLTPAQSKKVFLSLPVLPSFLVDVTGEYAMSNSAPDQDRNPSRFRIVTFYYRQDMRDEFLKWLGGLFDPDELPLLTPAGNEPPSGGRRNAAPVHSSSKPQSPTHDQTETRSTPDR